MEYSNKGVLNQLVRGLNDEEIQRKVLAWPEDKLIVEEVERFVMAEAPS